MNIEGEGVNSHGRGAHRKKLIWALSPNQFNAQMVTTTQPSPNACSKLISKLSSAASTCFHMEHVFIFKRKFEAKQGEEHCSNINSICEVNINIYSIHHCVCETEKERNWIQIATTWYRSETLNREKSCIEARRKTH